MGLRSFLTRAWQGVRDPERPLWQHVAKDFKVPRPVAFKMCADMEVDPLTSMRKSIGSRFFARIMASRGINTYGLYSGWSADRYTQALQGFKSWNYVAIDKLCQETARIRPYAAYVVREDQVLARKAKGAKFVGRHAREKALAPAQSNEELELVPSDHPAMRLLARPNPKEVFWQFMYRIAMWWRVTGNVYIWVVRNHVPRPGGIGFPCEFWVIPSPWVFPRTGKDRHGQDQVIAYYDIRPDGAENVRFETDEIIHIAKPGPKHWIDGHAANSSISEWVDIDNSIGRSRRNQFAKGAQPTAIAELDKEVLNPDEGALERFRKRFRQVYGSEENAGELLCAPPGVTFKPWQTAPKDMDYNAGAEQMRDFMLAAYTVSKSNVGMVEEASRASAETSRANLITGPVNSDLELFSQIFTVHIGQAFDPDMVVVWPDASPEDRQQKLAEWSAGASNGSVTPNEFRKEVLHLEPYEIGGNEPLVPSGLVEYPMNSKPQEYDWSSLLQRGNEKPVEGAVAPLDVAEPTANGTLPTAIAERLHPIGTNGDGKK
jgi:phage portal protein BeeE